MRLSLLVLTVLCSTVQRPVRSRLSPRARPRPRRNRGKATLPPADTRRAGLFCLTALPPGGAKPRRARGTAKRNVCTLYLVFKEPRPRRLSPSGVPGASRACRPRCPSGTDFQIYVTLACRVNPYFRLRRWNLAGPDDYLRGLPCSVPRTSSSSAAPRPRNRVERVSPI